MISRLLLIPLTFLILGCSSVATEYYPDGQKKSEISKKGDEYHGRATYWYENGVTQTTCNYERNELNGKLTSWHQTGKIQVEQEYRNGKLHGLVKGYNTDGELVSQGTYCDGVLHGIYSEFYPGRGPKLEGTYRNGKHDGTWLYYDIGGDVIGEGSFVDGTGKQRAFGPDGKIKQVTYYVDDQKHGDEVIYREDGSVEVINRFEKGKLVEKIDGSPNKK
jgi:antitoxin component YwqK of YwqJK toxin-antitoxin module